MNEDLKLGDRVQYDLDENVTANYGTVVLLGPDLIAIKPDNPAHVGMRYQNVRKVNVEL